MNGGGPGVRHRAWIREGNDEKTIPLFMLFAVIAASAAMVPGRDAVNAAPKDAAVQWSNYFVHVHLP